MKTKIEPKAPVVGNKCTQWFRLVWVVQLFVLFAQLHEFDNFAAIASIISLYGNPMKTVNVSGLKGNPGEALRMAHEDIVGHGQK